MYRAVWRLSPTPPASVLMKAPIDSSVVNAEMASSRSTFESPPFKDTNGMCFCLQRSQTSSRLRTHLVKTTTFSRSCKHFLTRYRDNQGSFDELDVLGSSKAVLLDNSTSRLTSQRFRIKSSE